ncbi:MAG: protein kinase [Myxococcales bacterium]
MASDPNLYGKYQLLELLARGGMGEVWKARSHGIEGFEKTLVIKRILPELSRNPNFVELFIDEAKTAVTLTHANIVQVFDLGRAEGCYFIAMEYVPGFDLGKVLAFCAERGRAIPQELAVYVVSELAKGLDYAHRRRDADLKPLGIVHRDVSPENVLISFEGEVKLTDFGIARSREQLALQGEVPPGKFAYLSPEQARGEEVDARADLFSVGMILYEALTGKRPLEELTAEGTFERAKSGSFAPLGEVLPGVSPELAAIVSKATAKDRDVRYANAGDLYEDLIQFLYASGRRISSHDLSAFIEELSHFAATEKTEVQELPPISGLEEIFSEPTNTGVSSARGVTPVRVPSRSTTSSVPVAARSGIPPRSEWREVSLLAFDGLPRSEVMSFATRFGGAAFPGNSASEPTLVLFGLTEADGRDAQGAARCALRILRTHTAARVRAIVHSGRVLLDAEGKLRVGPPLEALRTESRKWLARVSEGQVAASPAATKLLRGRFELAPAQADGPRVIERERRADEGNGKFVGRRQELRLLGECLALANKGRLVVVGVRGEAGSGKTRLITETARRLSHAGHDVGLYVATCSPEGRTIPFHAVQEILRVVLGIEEMEPEGRLREKVDRLRLLGLSAPQREAVGRVLGLGLHTSSVTNTTMLMGALVRISYKLAQDRLTVFAWDGAELMDTPSRELLGKMVLTPLPVKAVALFTYRPTDETPWNAAPAYTELVLRPLSAEDVARFCRHRLVVHEVPEELVRELSQRSGGNPLYLEELVAAMRELGAIEVRDGVVEFARPADVSELPNTLRGLVTSRVGKLDAAHRVILQLAVTCGPRFSPELLARAAQQDEASVRQALSVLDERGIVRPLGPGEYTFAHDLAREIFYDSIPHDERPALHAAVAEAIEALRPNEIEAAADRLAYHHREAGQAERAATFLVRAAQRLESEQASDAAVDAYLEALDLLTRSGTSDGDLLLDLYTRLGELAYRSRTAEGVAERLAGALELADKAGRDDLVARFSMMRGRLYLKVARAEEGRAWLERAQGVARKRGDGELERDVALAAAEAHARSGEYNSVLRHVGHALELARTSQDAGAQLRCLLVVAPAYAAVGREADARRALAEIERLSASRQDQRLEVETERVRALVAYQAGDHEGRIESARKAFELAKEYGLPHEAAVAAHMLGEFYLRGDEDKRAFAALRSSSDIATEHGFTRVHWLNVCLLGFLDVLSFGAEEGLKRMREALRYAGDHGYVWDSINGQYLLAIAEQRVGSAQAASLALRHVRELAERHGHRRMGIDAAQAERALERGQPIALPS